ncbi:MAG: glycosyl hydrolase family 18 protein, partial [Oscillospiraceae bacterium]
MKKQKNEKILFLLCGIAIGVIVTLLTVFFMLLAKNVPQKPSQTNSNNSSVSSSIDKNANSKSTSTDKKDEDKPLETDTYKADAIYNGGEIVSYKGKMYKARWWTQGETPGASAEGAWENLMTADPNADPNQPANVNNVPIDTKIPKNTAVTDFKVVGYYPSWSPEKLDRIDFNVLTHINYAFAIPKSDGTLMPLESPETANAIIASAHKNSAKVLLAVGGWSYHETPLEPTFVSATDSPDKIKKFGDEIIKMCTAYGFDGIDMDWEHPRVDGSSAKQYEDLMVYLSEKLHADGKLLTSAVLSG